MLIGVLAVGVPVSLYLEAGNREWRMGDSIAAALTDPFFSMVIGLRASVAVLLALLLWRFRTPVSVAIAITALWLVGPPITILWAGMTVMAASLAQRSWVEGAWDSVVWSCILPTIVTIYLLGSPKARRVYGIFQPAGSAEKACVPSEES